jgi:hypothetical protein
MKRKRFSEEQIIGILKEHEAGVEPTAFAQQLQLCSMLQTCFHPTRLSTLLPTKTRTLCAAPMPVAMQWQNAKKWPNGGRIIWIGCVLILVIQGMLFNYRGFRSDLPDILYQQQ